MQWSVVEIVLAVIASIGICAAVFNAPDRRAARKNKARGVGAG